MHPRQFKEFNKQYVDNNIGLFLKCLKEKWPAFAEHGVCNGYAFSIFRAEAIGESAQHIQRLHSLSNVSPNTIKAMARVLLDYRAELSRLSQSQSYKKSVQALMAPLDKKTEQDTMASIRQQCFEIIEFKAYQDTKNKRLLKKAEDLYAFISMLFASAHPGALNVYTDRTWIKQNDFLDMLRLFPAGTMLEAKQSPEKNPSLPVKQVFDFAFSFTPQELLALLENKWGKVFKEGDFVQIASTDHTMYFSIKDGEYRFYDQVPIALEPNTAKELLNHLKEKFFTNYHVKADYMPISLTVYAKNSSIPDVRKNEIDVLAAILKARGYDHRGQIKNINAEGWDKVSSVYLAAYQGCPTLVKMLAQQGADVNKADCEGGTPVYVAAKAHNLTCLDVLAECKADFNKPKFNGMTAVHQAAQHGACDVLQKLHEHGARFDFKNRYKATPLMLAINSKEWAAAAFCLTAMMDVPMRNEWLPKYMTQSDALQKLAQGSVEYSHRFIKDPAEKLNFLEEVLQGKNALGKLLLCHGRRYDASGMRMFDGEHPLSQIQMEYNRLKAPPSLVRYEHAKCR